MSFQYQETIVINITDYLEKNKNTSIKKILDILDMTNIDDKGKKKLRQVILDEFNNNHIIFCKVLSFIQEQKADNLEIT